MRTLFAPFVCLAAVVAQEPPPPLPAAFFAGRRQAVMELIRQESEPGQQHVVVLRGAPARADMATFHQDQDFYYLSGVSEPAVAMLLWPQTGAEELLVPPFSPFAAKWEGGRLKPGEEAAAATGFAVVGNARSLHRRLPELLESDAGDVVVWTFTAAQPGVTATPASARNAERRRLRDRFDGRVSREARFVERLEEDHDGIEVRDLTPLVGRLRAIKTPEEIAQIRAASEIAVEGLAEAIRSTRPGVYEYQIAAAARYVFSRLGAGPDAYAAIVGAGPNGCILHYSANSRRVEDGDLIVMDYGPTVHGYCTDVTRTFPASGKFTDEQRELVADVYEVQQALIARVEPGARVSRLTALCGRMLRERGYGVDHGPSHHVGLAVHDKQGDVLLPGMVLTVEPGAYLRDKGMGCRIEDVVLVTEDGHEVLSARLPASPAAIEELMQSAGIQQSRVGLPNR